MGSPNPRPTRRADWCSPAAAGSSPTLWSAASSHDGPPHPIGPREGVLYVSGRQDALEPLMIRWRVFGSHRVQLLHHCRACRMPLALRLLDEEAPSAGAT